jgi:DNA-binding transcriptional regulator YiaG
MANVLYMELGFPVLLVDARMVEIRGELVPDVNSRHVQEAAFRLLVGKPGRLTGSEVRFIRKHLRMRQLDLAKVLNMANHSVVSQWESRGEEAAGMDYNTEVLLRIWMAARIGLADRLLDLLEMELKNLSPEAAREPLRITMDEAA